MANNYKPGECHTHIMTDEERDADRKQREELRKKYPWRYSGLQAIADYMDYTAKQKLICARGKRRPNKSKARRKDK